MSVQNGSEGTLYSIILWAEHEHSWLIEGECCNLLRRLHVARGEFGTILLPLWSTERSHSGRGAKTLVHFHQPWWHKFSLTCRYDCQSASSAQRGNRAGDRNLGGLSHYEVSLKPDRSFLSLGIKSVVQTAARAVSTYTQNMGAGTHIHSSSKSLQWNIFCSGFFFEYEQNNIQLYAKYFIAYNFFSKGCH